ncbi:MAG TPA: 1,4-alpha-glucan branching protein GlgB [Fontimonas sp.]
MLEAQLKLDADAARALAEATVADPFALLGPHGHNGARVIRAFVPGAQAVEVIPAEDAQSAIALQPAQVPGLFIGAADGVGDYQLRVHWPAGEQQHADPYAFGPLLGEQDLWYLREGRHRHLGDCLGAHVTQIRGVSGVRFAVWAPNARRVSVVGDFNSWDGRRHPMRLRAEAGIWELFIPGLGAGTAYKYEVLGAHGLLPLKADPVAAQMEASPGTSSLVADPRPYEWTDAAWMASRARRQSPQAPLSIYELHAGSWQRPGGHAPNWDALGDLLIPYVASLGFTHIELMPVSAHPFGGSWGYQPLGLFAPHPVYGEPAALKRFVDRCHAQDIGVLIDWVPAHFPADTHGLARFDGTAMYEHADPREGFHHDWNTLIYNFGRHEVSGFLIGSALHWLEHYHIDGLRVDAVASMLYRDYSRPAGEWIPNRHGGRENLEAIAFLRELNQTVHERFPGALMIAEESTAFPGVTAPVADGGLGFSYKWNMGWMHDTLRYIGRDPVHRAYAHNDISFGLVYAFSERFVLPLSHDEVVHGKRSIFGRMPGDLWQRHANLRAYYGFMWTHPGKKLLFMGSEFGQTTEWNHDRELDWALLEPQSEDAPLHSGVQRLIRDLNQLYVSEPALHVDDCDAGGFRWLIGDDQVNSVYAFLRVARDGSQPPLLVVCNFTPVPRNDYRIGVPIGGRWHERLNTDRSIYGGSDYPIAEILTAVADPAHGEAWSLSLSLPPLATLVLKPGIPNA